MGKTYLGKEILVTTTNKVGALAKWTGLFADARVNIWGCCAWTDGNKANFAFTTDNNAKAISLLKNAGYTPDEHDVVVTELEDEPGTLWQTATKLSNAGIDGKYMYVTSCGGCSTTRAVFGTTDNKKAVKVLVPGTEDV